MKISDKGLLIVFSGPAGSGKSTVLAGYMNGRDNCVFSVSATSRKPRDGEKDGVNYHFVSREKFEEMLNTGEMLEHTEYCGNYYGTPLKPILKALDEGKDVIFDIEVDGAFQVKEKYPEAVLIFMKPPSIEELHARLKGRNTESEEVIAKRMARAEIEMGLSENYDYIIVNETVDKAIEDLEAVIEYEHEARK